MSDTRWHPIARLIEKWRKSRAHTYASENADHYRGFDAGLARCADELEAALHSLAEGQAEAVVSEAHATPENPTVEADRWQPIETAPKDHEAPEPILTWDGSRIELTTRGFTAELRRAGWFNHKGWLIHPTHWMPLPSPPLADRAASLAAPAQEKK